MQYASLNLWFGMKVIESIRLFFKNLAKRLSFDKPTSIDPYMKPDTRGMTSFARTLTDHIYKSKIAENLRAKKIKKLYKIICTSNDFEEIAHASIGLDKLLSRYDQVHNYELMDLNYFIYQLEAGTYASMVNSSIEDSISSDAKIDWSYIKESSVRDVQNTYSTYSDSYDHSSLKTFSI